MAHDVFPLCQIPLKVPLLLMKRSGGFGGGSNDQPGGLGSSGAVIHSFKMEGTGIATI